MSETCAVCKKGVGPTKCEICGFSDDGSINRSFPVPEDLNNWLETVVKPYRASWEAKKEKDKLLAELEEAKKKENELSAQLEEAKKREAGLLARLSGLPETFTDPRDGKAYRTVKIGDQVWMAENLNFDYSGSKCYDNDSNNVEKYGRLYDWETAKKACPPGWHLPSNEEWQTLVDFAGGEKFAGKKLKAKNGWNDYEGKSSNGTDEFGFSALPGGSGSSAGSFHNVGRYGNWWSASESNSNYAYSRRMSYYREDAYLFNYDKSNLLSVRCLQDKA